ncbi:broad substrate specificity ATP-binding cassette transporter ABCG2d isoform X3 [Hypomesus transpacificus]|uniref:broad substrate specificity ATP-binding cassette transporter ABCG2d isoform X3 n=1 Tax=Hypomesus transpacificus TaxID=137520 RepID=UPI001F077CFF|nr:broad substrate specificity ATP-binding cassette transporter ABCG2d isoform X3 [Hypomesus transpacificus]
MGQETFIARRMERANHINIAMTDDPTTNGMPKSKVIFTVDKSWQPMGAVVSFHDIQYKVVVKSGPLCKRKVTPRGILVDLNGMMRPGLNAILGPTGSGKSSFLDVLAARKDPSGLSGEVLIDGAPQPPNYKCLSGYVVQVGTQLIRGISGGERKRTNIGMELIMDPSVLFLDEPTTGLDASTANSVLLLLKRMANQGRTIIMSIHQPRYSIYRLFDTLTLLVNGKMVYHGPGKNALDYFADIGYTCEPHNNPADFFLDVINGDATGNAMNKMQSSDEIDLDELMSSRQRIEEHLVEQYRSSPSCRETLAQLELLVRGRGHGVRPQARTITYNCSFFHQLHWVLKRTFKNLLLNPQTSVAQLGVTIFLALIVGAIFFGVKDDQSGIQNRMGALFFITTNQCFSTLSAAELFITERKLFVHEYISGYYRVSVYFLSKILSDIITLRTIPAVIFSCIIYFMIGLQKTAAAFFIFTFTVIMVAYTATAMTMAISADQNVVAVANIFMTISFVFMMIFSGLLVNLTSIMDWLAWLKYFSIPRYGLTALEINEFVGLSFCNHLAALNTTVFPGTSNCTMSTPGITCTGEQHLQYLGIGYTNWDLWQNHVAMAIMTILFLLIAYLKLRFIKKFT